VIVGTLLLNTGCIRRPKLLLSSDNENRHSRLKFTFTVLLDDDEEEEEEVDALMLLLTRSIIRQLTEGDSVNDCDRTDRIA